MEVVVQFRARRILDDNVEKGPVRLRQQTRDRRYRQLPLGSWVARVSQQAALLCGTRHCSGEANQIAARPVKNLPRDEP